MKPRIKLTMQPPLNDAGRAGPEVLVPPGPHPDGKSNCADPAATAATKALQPRVKIAACLAALASVALAWSSAADTQLTLSDGVTTIVVSDGGPGDQNPTAGVVSWSGFLDNWFLNVSTGSTTPALGTPSSPSMDLNSVNAVSSAGGTLKITFSASGFTGQGVATASIGGTTDGAVTYKTRVNSSLLTTSVVSLK